MKHAAQKPLKHVKSAWREFQQLDRQERRLRVTAYSACLAISGAGLALDPTIHNAVLNKAGHTVAVGGSAAMLGGAFDYFRHPKSIVDNTGPAPTPPKQYR